MRLGCMAKQVRSDTIVLLEITLVIGVLPPDRGEVHPTERTTSPRPQRTFLGVR